MNKDIKKTNKASVVKKELLWHHKEDQSTDNDQVDHPQTSSSNEWERVNWLELTGVIIGLPNKISLKTIDLLFFKFLFGKWFNSRTWTYMNQMITVCISDPNMLNLMIKMYESHLLFKRLCKATGWLKVWFDSEQNQLHFFIDKIIFFPMLDVIKQQIIKDHKIDIKKDTFFNEYCEEITIKRELKNSSWMIR